MSAVLTLDCRSLEQDATPAASLRVICSGCDPDNPRSVPRARCKRCGGTGLASPELASIVREIGTSRLELLQGHEGRDEED
jgi:hypothetical protein